jgi:hypothetical protein
MVVKPWKDWTDEELAGEAEIGRRGQGAVVESTRRLIVAIEASGDCAARQTDQVIALTDRLKLLTYLLIGLGLVQTALMIWLK